MKLIDNEQSERQVGAFLKVEDKSVLTLKSKLVAIDTCYVNDEIRSVLWHDSFDYKGLQKRKEYLYRGSVKNGDNEDTGIIRVPAGVFFAMNEAERLAGINKREVQWVIGKKGSGKATKYSTVQGRPVTTTPEIITANTEKLMKALTGYEQKLAQKTDALMAQWGNGATETKKEEVAEPAKPEGETEQPVNSDDIPF